MVELCGGLEPCGVSVCEMPVLLQISTAFLWHDWTPSENQALLQPRQSDPHTHMISNDLWKEDSFWTCAWYCIYRQRKLRKLNFYSFGTYSMLVCELKGFIMYCMGKSVWIQLSCKVLSWSVLTNGWFIFLPDAFMIKCNDYIFKNVNVFIMVFLYIYMYKPSAFLPRTLTIFMVTASPFQNISHI